MDGQEERTVPNDERTNPISNEVETPTSPPPRQRLLGGAGGGGRMAADDGRYGWQQAVAVAVGKKVLPVKSIWTENEVTLLLIRRQ